jgi:hypothetical protein
MRRLPWLRRRSLAGNGCTRSTCQAIRGAARRLRDLPRGSFGWRQTSPGNGRGGRSTRRPRGARWAPRQLRPRYEDLHRNVLPRKLGRLDDRSSMDEYGASRLYVLPRDAAIGTARPEHDLRRHDLPRRANGEWHAHGGRDARTRKRHHRSRPSLNLCLRVCTRHSPSLLSLSLAKQMATLADGRLRLMVSTIHVAVARAGRTVRARSRVRRVARPTRGVLVYAVKART